MKRASAFLFISSFCIVLSACSAGGPLHIASGQGDLRAMQGALNSGADLNEHKGKMSNLIDGWSLAGCGGPPLHHAAYHCRAEAVKFLIDKGADVNARGCSGLTALHRAAVKDCVEVIRLLLDNGADLTAYDTMYTRFRYTPLEWAALSGSFRAVRLLIEKGADPEEALIKIQRKNHHLHAQLNPETGMQILSAVVRRDQKAGLAGSWTPAQNIEVPKTGQVNLHGVAVIIGNRNYATVGKDVPDVVFAHNDADAMYRYVTETLGYREGNVILLKDASQADMIATFGVRGNPKGKLFDWVRSEQSDVFVYYSGHGAPGLGDGRSYLLPIDADPLKVELNGYLLETLYANLGQLSAKSTTVLLDSCFSGLTAAGSMIKGASSITLRPLEVKTDPSRMTVITASALNQVASWDDKAKHGLFTSHFLQGVSRAADQKPYGNEDGKVTLAELQRYMEEEVTYHARRAYGRDQNPQVSGNPAAVLADLQGQ